jgi:transcription initiation factor IIE alpha subunit
MAIVNMVLLREQLGKMRFEKKAMVKCPECGAKLRVYNAPAIFPLNDADLLYTETRLICMKCRLKSEAHDLNAWKITKSEAFEKMAERMTSFDGSEVFADVEDDGTDGR